MAIRLNKVVRDLNITFDRAINFLEEKGIQLEGGANAKISDEQYDMLVNEFSSDKKLKTDSEKISQGRQNKDRSKQPTIAIDDYKPKDEDNEIKTTIPDDKQPQIKTVGHINLDEINGHKKTQKDLSANAERSQKMKNDGKTMPAFCRFPQKARAKVLPLVPHNHDFPPVVITCTVFILPCDAHFVNGVLKIFL